MVEKYLWVISVLLAFAIWAFGAFGLRIRQRGYPIEIKHPVLYQNIMKSTANCFYFALVVSVPVITIFMEWNGNIINVLYIMLLPWIVFIRARTWIDKSSLIEYRFFENDLEKTLGVTLPLAVFSLLSILHLVVIAGSYS